jgi:type IV pilus assembly protein PilQ
MLLRTTVSSCPRTRTFASAPLLSILLAVVGPWSRAAAAAAPATTPAPPGGQPTVATAAAANAPSPISPPYVLPAHGTYRISGNADAINVFAVSMDAQELFTALAIHGNIPIVVDDSVSRKITVNILGHTARQTIDDIAAAYGLSIADIDGVTMISEGIPRSPSSYLLSDISSIPTKYVIAANARTLLPVFLQDYVKVNAEQNAVVLSAPKDVLGKFREDISQFDIPASQIVVELLLVELTDTTVDNLGLSVNFLNAAEGPGINPSVGTITYTGLTTLSQQFQANLTALEQQGKAQVRADPRIATVSGQPASIFVGTQRYVATPIYDAQGNQSNNISAGVQLNVTPYTGGKGQVLVNIAAEVSTLSPPDPVTGLPTKSTRTANTTVRVTSGQTVVIGGLTQDELRSVRNKIPLLGDIPVLGPAFFQNLSVNNTHTELVLFITPRILSDTGHLPGDVEKALKARFLDSDLSKPLPAIPPPTDPTMLKAGGGDTSGARP